MLTDLDRFWQIVRRRIYVIVAICGCGAIVAPFVPMILHPTYHATARLLVVNEVSKTTVDASADVPTIAQSGAVLERVKDRLKLDGDLEDFRRRVKAKVPAHSSIMEITAGDRDADRAATIANAIADETVLYYRQIATQRYQDVTQQLGQTIVQLRSQIDGVNKRLQKVSVDNPYANSDKASDDLTAQIGTLKMIRNQAYADLLADRATSSALADQGSKIGGIVDREALKNDPVYTALEAQIAADEATLAVQNATYTSANPALISVREKVALERSQLQDAKAAALQKRADSSTTYATQTLAERSAAGKVAGDEARLRALDTEIADDERHLRDTFGPGASVQVLRAERDAAQQQYLAVTQRLSTAQADQTQAASLGTLVVVDRAVAYTALWKLVFTLFPLIYALFVCALAVAAAYGLETIDRRFRDSREIEEFYGRPVFEIGRQ